MKGINLHTEKKYSSLRSNEINRMENKNNYMATSKKRQLVVSLTISALQNNCEVKYIENCTEGWGKKFKLIRSKELH